MRLEDLQHDHEYCLRIATKLLGEQARALVLDSEIEVILLRQSRLVSRHGLRSGPGVVCVSSDRKGHSLEIGVERYRCTRTVTPIDVLRFSAPHHLYAPYSCYEFWAVADSSFRTLYRSLRKQARQRQCQSPPLLREGDLDKLWKNTIGFLRHGRHLLERFGVPQKRGVLLLGEPGNGKTMACRWLRTECAAHRLHCKVVTAEQFEAARNEGEAQDLFDSSHPGIILFDDVDLGMRDSGSESHSAAQSTFLCGLDGLSARSGIVYLFTSNVSWSSIDPAFRRPGASTS